MEDNKEGLSAIISTLSDVGESIFGEDIEAFTTWMDGFLAEQKKALEESMKSTYLTTTSSGSGSGAGEDEKTFMQLLKEGIGSKLDAFSDGGANGIISLRRFLRTGSRP